MTSGRSADTISAAASRTDHEVRIGLARCAHLRLLTRISNLLEEEIARHIKEYRTRTAAACKIERLTDRRYKIRRILYLIVVLCHGHRHVKDVRLLKGVASEKGNVHLPRDRDHWNRVHIRRRKPRHEIRRARSRRSDADTDTPRRPRITIRRMRGILLMRHENLMHSILPIECIIKRQDHPAGVAEQSINALLLQTRQNSFRTSHTHTPQLHETMIGIL